MKQSDQGAGNPSIVRRAITLVLHHPETAVSLDIERLAAVSKPGSDLFRDLIETVQADPNMTTAGLLERFRNHEEGRHLGKLVAVELPRSEDFDPGAELTDCIAQLELVARKERMDFLIEKQRLGDLSDVEKDELRALSQGSPFEG